MQLAPLTQHAKSGGLLRLAQSSDGASIPDDQKTQSSLVGDDWVALQLTSAAFGATEAESLSNRILAQSATVAQQ